MLSFRDFAYTDADLILSWIDSERALRLWSADTYGEYPLSSSDIISRYEFIRSNHGENVRILMAEEDGVPAGHIVLRRLGDEKDTVRFGYIIVDSRIRGRGYGKKLLSLAEDYAIRCYGAQRLTLGVFENNLPAFKCYSSFGFCKCSDELVKIGDESWKCFELEKLL